MYYIGIRYIVFRYTARRYNRPGSKGFNNGQQRFR